MKWGVGIISFDRPIYLNKLLKSMALNDLEGWDVHLFQDGEVNKFSGRQTTVKGMTEKCIKIYQKSGLGTVHRRGVNVGNAINQFEAIEFMADNYDKFLIIEDDVIISKYYFKLLKLLDKYIEDNVFSGNLGFKRLCDRSNIIYNLNRLVKSNDKVGSSVHWWAELYTSKNWHKVRKDFLTYYEFVKNVDYKLRPSKEITEFFHSQGFTISQTSQDAGRDFALYKNNMIRLTTVVNRGIYIGEYGMHFRPLLYARGGWDKQYPYIHPTDRGLKRFVL